MICNCEVIKARMPRWKATNRWNKDKVGTPIEYIICNCPEVDR